MFAPQSPLSPASPGAIGTYHADSHAMVIETSWDRSRRAGLRTHESQDFHALATTDLRLLREQNTELMRHAAPVMETLHQQIIDTDSMVVLTDAKGVVLHSIGDDSFEQQAAKVALRPGVNWGEAQKGTNAIGTSIHERAPVVVHANEHFLTANHGLTCSAAPIFAPAGDLLGVLDVTGDYRGFHKHTMGLVRMSAQMIENTLFRRTYFGQLIVAFHARAEFIGTLMEGLLAIAPDGRILAANRSACLQTELSLSSIRTHTALSLLRRAPSELFELAYLAINKPLQCVLPSGVRIFAVPATTSTRTYAAAAREETSAAPPERATRADAPVAPTATKPAAVRPDAPTQTLPQANFDDLDSGDAQVASVIARLRRVAATDVSILLEAETGAGKEWFSLAIHRASARRDGPFVAINCAAVPEGLIESELFGYEDGAFTGARRKGHQGKLLQAHGGTLFLDEIGDMPLAMQARLLRVLQERVVTPLGSGKAIPVDVRLVCATHKRLRDLIKVGGFRDDLYYRLNGLTVRLPALRERSDLREIVSRLLHAQGGPQWRLAPDVWALVMQHQWPGNLRQLSNVLATAMAIAAPGTVIGRDHLPDDFLDDVAELDSGSGSAANVAPPTNVSRRVSTDAAASLDDLALDAMQRALARHHGNLSAAARELGVSRNTLYRKLPKHQLRPATPQG
ncbi:sigma-54-dependent Fis family transcriptional regulator [Casimicrobium huifangae]|uniref:sigma-54-dependent Fis family transcriptional regulator n=1 Tax=Casimicrobium huifangae TaxID=2591109 RepID=UPI0037842BCE